LQILRFYLLLCGTDDAHLSEINIPVSINCGQIFVEDFCETLCVTFWYGSIIATAGTIAPSGGQADSDGTQYNARVTKHSLWWFEDELKQWKSCWRWWYYQIVFVKRSQISSISNWPIVFCKFFCFGDARTSI